MHKWSDIRARKFTPERLAELDREVAKESAAMKLREQALDAGRIHDRTAAFRFYLEAFFNDAAKAEGWDGGEVTNQIETGDAVFVAFQRKTPERSALEFQRQVSRDDCRDLMDRTEGRLYPDMENPEVGKAYLLRPQWHIEKTAARELVEFLQLPPPCRP